MKKDTPKLIKAILTIGYDPVAPEDVGEGAQLINKQWYMPRWGCDTLQHVSDILGDVIEQLTNDLLKN